MKKFWLISALVASVFALALFAATAVAQNVTVFTGFVTLNSANAPSGTTVEVRLQSTTGTVIGTGTTGGAGFAANQYRIDIQATSALEGQTVNLVVPGTSQATPATAVFNANTVRTVNIVATTTPGIPAAGTFLFKFGSDLASDGKLNLPQGVAVDASGNVYVADTNNYRIQRFTSTGTFLSKWGSSITGDGQFQFPRDVAVDASGNVYVADTNNHRIQKFTAGGSFLAKWGSQGSGDGQFQSPLGVAVDPSGNVYVSDRFSRIQKFTAGGSFLAKWGSFGSGDGQFNGSFGVAADASGNVYVADIGNHRIQKFTAGGSFLGKWGSQGSGDGQFQSPQGVAVDASGNVYVADTGNHRVQVFASGEPAVRGVCVFSGFVTINGAPAPVGTTVNVTLASSGAVIGTGTTGGAGFAANQYRIDIQSTAALEGQTVFLVVPNASQATQATAVFNANTVRIVNIVATTGGAVPVATALAGLIATGHLVLVSSFNYTTVLYEAFVPNLPGNVLTVIRPHSVIFITLTQAHTVVVSGNSFPISANTPTPVPVEAIVTITLQY